MAGTGFDALMMREAPEGLKGALGWPAYIVGGARSLRRSARARPGRARRRAAPRGRRPHRARRQRRPAAGGAGAAAGRAPGRRRARRRARRATQPEGLGRPSARGLTRRHRPDHRLELFRARRVRVVTRRTEARQVDGDLIDDGRGFTAVVDPGALVVRVPAHHPRRPEGGVGMSTATHVPETEPLRAGGAVGRRRARHGPAGRREAPVRRHLAPDAVRRRLQLHPRDRVPVRARAGAAAHRVHRPRLERAAPRSSRKALQQTVLSILPGVARRRVQAGADEGPLVRRRRRPGRARRSASSSRSSRSRRRWRRSSAGRTGSTASSATARQARGTVARPCWPSRPASRRCSGSSSSSPAAPWSSRSSASTAGATRRRRRCRGCAGRSGPCSVSSR